MKNLLPCNKKDCIRSDESFHSHIAKRLDAAVLSGVLVLSVFLPFSHESSLFSSVNSFLSLTVNAQSVSDNAYSDTQVDTSAGDVMDETGHVTNSVQAEEQKQEEIQTNTISGWPQGPAITAGSAILVDADTGTILYGKNVHQRMYPASTTKMLTCLIAAENLDLSDTITFSQTAIDAVPADGSNIGMSVGETITVEQALYGLMVGSANECANALAEKVSGTIDDFVILMNQKASELGCVDSNFVNTNGLYDENHYTSAYDLSRIAIAFFQNDVCRNVGNCASYHFEATETQPDDFTLTNKHELITGQIPYSGIIGGKTGYTSQSHENLVTGCIQNDTELVAVVMREDDPAQFNDTVSLFDYGYDNFTKKSVKESAILPASDFNHYLNMGTNLLGSDTPALEIADGGFVDLPNGSSFSDLIPVYGKDNSITYYFGSTDSNGAIVGTAALIPASETNSSSSSDTVQTISVSPAEEILQSDQNNNDSNTVRTRLSNLFHLIAAVYITTGLNGTVYVNVSAFLISVIVISIILAICFRIRASMHDAREEAKKRRRRARRAHAGRNDYDQNRRYESSDSFDSYDPTDYYNNDDYDNGFSSNYNSSNNYRDDYYGKDPDFYDDYYYDPK